MNKKNIIQLYNDATHNLTYYTILTLLILLILTYYLNKSEQDSMLWSFMMNDKRDSMLWSRFNALNLDQDSMLWSFMMNNI